MDRRYAPGPRALATAVALLALAAWMWPAVSAGAPAARLLFIGNSFTYADGSAVRFYRADTVTDLNGTGIGGVPALFESFTRQSGLGYEVWLETEPGVGLDWHLEHRAALIAARRWDAVVMHGYSTLDRGHPGDPALLIDSATRLSALLRQRSPSAALWLEATWPRADQIHERSGAWYGAPVAQMAHDIRAGYDRAAAAARVRGVIPVGESWVRAIDAGIADTDPYDGIAAGQVDLWARDHYHASTDGYYLSALVIFGAVTGRDPRALGPGECSGFELGLPVAEIEALERLAAEELKAQGLLTHPLDAGQAPGAAPARCSPARR